MRIRMVRGVPVPGFFYGTAWKEEDTAGLTALALASGFRAIDTANQRRHYFEAAVGEAVSGAIGRGELAREEVFLQTKFTHRAGQDHRLPYDPTADLATQVRQSFASSLGHLETSYVDSYVLHGPSARSGIPAADWEAWRAMEGLYTDGKARLLGVSNVTAEQLRVLCAGARVKPAFVQNRCYATTGWDREVRAFCRAHDVVYQGFSLLTANVPVLRSPAVRAASERLGRPETAVVFRFALEVGMIPLTGTGDPAHMADDLGAFDFELSPDEVRAIEGVAG